MWGSVGDSAFGEEEEEEWEAVLAARGDAGEGEDESRKLRGMVEISRSSLRPRGRWERGRGAVMEGSVMVDESHVVGSGVDDVVVVAVVLGEDDGGCEGSCCLAMLSHA